MPVPGHSHDVFLSYAHKETEWVETFKKALAAELDNMTDWEVEFWQDKNKIRTGEDFKEAITVHVKEAATFFAILSPSSLKSYWCPREWEIFLKQHGSSAGPPEERDCDRFFKVVKRPAEEGMLPLKRVQEVWFYDRESQGEFREDSEGFREAIRKTASDLWTRLKQIRDSKPTVYLAHGPSDIDDHSKRFRDQMNGWGYNVPARRLTSSDDRQLLANTVRTGSFAVFIVCSEFDSFMEDQMELALDLGRNCLVWIDTYLTRWAKLEQLGFISRIRMRAKKRTGPRVEIFEGQSQEQFLEYVREKLRDIILPKKSGADDVTPGAIYLVYEPGLPAESDLAEQVKTFLYSNQIPVIDSNGQDDESRPMKAATSVLVLRADPRENDDWLTFRAMDVRTATIRYGRAQDFKVIAFLVANPSRLDAIKGNALVKGYGQEPLTSVLAELALEFKERSAAAGAAGH